MLEREIALFDKRLPEFLKTHENQYTLIKGKDCAFFPTEGEAIEHGLDKFGATSFLVRKVVREQPKIEIPALSFGLLNARI